MKRVLLTGAAGFIGANVARRLLEDGYEATLMTGPGSDCWRLGEVEGSAPVVQVDLADGDAVAKAVSAARPEWILHLAAHGAYSWQTDRAAILRTNVVGTANLLEAALRAEVQAFVNTGSSSEYGLKDRAPTEEDPLEPNSAYAVAKASATMLCRHVAEADGLNACTLRLYSAYGPWEEPRRLVPALAVEGLHGRFPPLVDPQTARDFVWVGDIVDAYLRAAQAVHAEPGAVYNVGTGTQTTVGEAAEIARSVLGVEATPRWGSMTARSWDTDCWVADSSKIRRLLNWRPTRDFREGFEELASWFRDKPDLLSYYVTARA
jgi:nucleoside-diphosphate-sugar epimerase